MMNSFKRLSLSLILILSFPSILLAATQFISTINTASEDYNTLVLWENAMDNAGDITAADVKVFSHGGVTGTVGDGASVTGQTSGATGTVIHATTTQILIDAILGTFQSGEVVQVSAGNSVTISNAGDSPIIVAYVYDDQGAMSSATTTVIGGFTTNATNYVLITVPTGERHNGTVSVGASITTTTGGQGTIEINNANVIVEWLILSGAVTTSSNRSIIFLDTITNSNPIIRNCIIYNGNNAGTGTYNGIGGAGGGTNNFLNNVIYGNEGSGIAVAGSSITHNSFNNTVYNNGDTGIVTGNGTQVFKNNLSIGNVTADYGSSPETITTCGSGDATGTSGLQSLVASTEWIDPTGSPANLHLNTGASSINAGTDLGTTNNVDVDIDGTNRSGTWDLSADDFISTARRVFLVN